MKVNCLLWLAAASIALGGCSRGKGKAGKQPPPPPATTGESGENGGNEREEPAEVRSEEKPSSESDKQEKKVDQNPPVIAVPPVALPPTNQSPQQRELQPSVEEKQVQQDGASGEQASEQVKEKAGEISRRARGVFNRSPESEKREDALESTREQNQLFRKHDLSDLKRSLGTFRPPDEAAVLEAIRPNDEATKLLAALVTSSNPIQADSVSGELVDELFNEPDQTRAKVIKVQMGLRHLAEKNLYEVGVAKRVAYLQSILDQRVREDHMTDLLRDGLFIAGTSVVTGTIGGLHVIERTRLALNNIRAKGGFWAATKARLARMFGRSGAPTASKGGLFGKLPAREVVGRNLKALGLDDEAVKNLQLIPVKRGDIPLSDFKNTNMPGFRFAVAERLDAGALQDKRLIVFALSRRGYGGGRVVYLSSREITPDEAQRLTRNIAYRSSEDGGQSFAAIVDESSGELTGTRLTAEELQGATPPPQDGSIRPTSTAQADSTAAATPARRFDKPWAATTALSTAVPLFGFYYLGYREGSYYGEDYQTLYLESLIPQDRLSQVLADLSGPGPQKQ